HGRRSLGPGLRRDDSEPVSALDPVYPRREKFLFCVTKKREDCIAETVTIRVRSALREWGEFDAGHRIARVLGDCGVDPLRGAHLEPGGGAGLGDLLRRANRSASTWQPCAVPAARTYHPPSGRRAAQSIRDGAQRVYGELMPSQRRSRMEVGQ